ncbi:MAG TPA: TetR/AcrR family transcriptional regulator [Nocardioides sp.]|nr:TetR/AcrR family transcriptional regulator [Nocardioides sp.]
MIDGDERRTALVRAARDAIEELGPGVGMAQIAERAGIRRPNVYRLFASKEQLDREVARQASKELLSHVRPQLTSTGLRYDVVRAMIDQQFGWAAQHPHLYRFVTAQRQAITLQGDRGGRPQFLSEIVDTTTAHARRVVGDVAVPAPDAVLASLMGMVDAGTLWWLDHHDETQSQVVDRLARQVLLVLEDVLTSVGIDPAVLDSVG